MDYEQKYKEALDWMRSVYPTMTGANKEDAEHFFPELKESEDERVIKELTSLFKDGIKGINHRYTGEDCERWIAWLEKQGEKDEEILILKDQIESLHAAIEAVKETHRIELKKQGEQKPAWSKDGITRINEIIETLNIVQANRVRTQRMHYNKATIDKNIDWLKSLKDRYTWKPTEEQIEALDSATENCAYSEYQDCLRELIRQLKKLREE